MLKAEDFGHAWEMAELEEGLPLEKGAESL
jgi:hypothetical protein